MPTTDATPERVIVHLHVHPHDRNRLRALAALRGVAELVVSWAKAEAERLGLPTTPTST